MFVLQDRCPGLRGGRALRVCRVLVAHEPHVNDPQPLNWENPSSSCSGELGHACGEAGRGGEHTVTAWAWVGVGSDVEFLMMFLTCAEMLQLLEEPRQEPQEILA